MKRYLEAAWMTYSSICVPVTASEGQRKEYRQAFLSGASVLMSMQVKAMSKGKGVTPADMAFMADLQRELDEFGASLDARYLEALARGLQ